MLHYAELEYLEAPFHYALMLFDPFSRGWCLYEMMVRILAGMRAMGFSRPEDMVPLILRRDPRFTRLVIVPGLTDVVNDVNGKLYDRFGEMSVFDPADEAVIKQGIVRGCKSSDAFNLLIAIYRAAAIQHHRQVP